MPQLTNDFEVVAQPTSEDVSGRSASAAVGAPTPFTCTLCGQRIDDGEPGEPVSFGPAQFVQYIAGKVHIYSHGRHWAEELAPRDLRDQARLAIASAKREQDCGCGARPLKPASVSIPKSKLREWRRGLMTMDTAHPLGQAHANEIIQEIEGYLQ